ncbi:LytR/AlgR family response regulator transcription factor [Bifidobacterium phasiani]|uniref:Response regulator transcription factor n=1 Tax=Bifidobacterium phasiani TaxID=2834431 RepID=A0ABS6W798_9BIFI|nr:LytTR family DNA-binding domain-containing protein [Bifidobacterium phasiani]MBW3082356.1 response regulator transcription factor [Bifidobacterium phasiani]
MMRIAIVDNAPACQERLTGLCRRYGEEHGESFDITVFDDGDAFVSGYVPEWDVVIVDVDPDDVDGIGVMRRVRAMDDAVEAVLVSMSDEYAAEGYTVAAASYILKPPSYETFSRSLDRCIHASRGHARRSVTVVTGGHERRIRLDEIIYVDSVRHRTVVHTMLGNFQIVCSIVRFEDLLNELDHSFARANSGYLVNLAHVIAIDGHDAAMSNGDRLPISRPRRTEFRRRFSEYLAPGAAA